jgi:hypothetical protein
MAETDDLSARLAVLETVVRQLVTHLAVRSDDPPRWVATRKVLALGAVERGLADPGRPRNYVLDLPREHPRQHAERLRHAIDGFFGEVELVAADYAREDVKGTPRIARR